MQTDVEVSLADLRRPLCSLDLSERCLRRGTVGNRVPGGVHGERGCGDGWMGGGGGPRVPNVALSRSSS